jgi:hypothetical protein
MMNIAKILIACLLSTSLALSASSDDAMQRRALARARRNERAAGRQAKKDQQNNTGPATVVNQAKVDAAAQKVAAAKKALGN